MGGPGLECCHLSGSGTRNHEEHLRQGLRTCGTLGVGHFQDFGFRGRSIPWSAPAAGAAGPGAAAASGAAVASASVTSATMISAPAYVNLQAHGQLTERAASDWMQLRSRPNLQLSEKPPWPRAEDLDAPV